tara:strand:- start:139 stop:345 length:207 start_codon:yes stop_codon:yes gene_type:complete
MFTVEVVTDMVLTTLTVTICQVLPIWEVGNHLVMVKETMPIDINLTQRGVQVATVPSTEVVVLEAEKE